MIKNLETFDSCPICSSRALISLGRKKTINKNSNLEVSIIKCNECLHWHTNPSPNQNLLYKLYKEESPYVIGMKSWAKLTAATKLDGKLVPDKNWIVRELKNKNIGNLLEIGCGSGELLNKMKTLGWKSYGIDPGTYATSNNVFESHDKLPDNVKFDVIVFKDVMEHCLSPNDMLNEYKKYLKINAILFLCVPWSESKAANKRKLNWEMVKPIGHLHYFSKKSAEILLKKNNFKIEKTTTRNFYRNYYFSLFTNFAKILYLCFRPTKWWLLTQRLDKLTTMILLFPGDKYGDQLYIVAKKF